jgi:hypothetical protein
MHFVLCEKVALLELLFIYMKMEWWDEWHVHSYGGR